MSWSNPSQQEAQECYDAAKKKYDTAAEEYLRLSKLRDQYKSESAAAYQKYGDQCDRLAALKREDFSLKRVARYLKSNDGNADREIYLSRVWAIDVSAKLKEFITCSGVMSPPFGKAATSPCVADETFSARAKYLVDVEYARVRMLISQEEAKCSSSEDVCRELVKKVRACESDMADYKKTMDSCAFDMEHYKKYL
ncbi:MAG: hypothetical protein IKP47_05950 [Ruminococcus sp.]|nr:hypothetical protein [Ruminococcus sp.]